MSKAPGIQLLSETSLKQLAKTFKDQLAYGIQILDLVKPILEPTFNFDEESKSLLQSQDGQKALALFIQKLSQLNDIQGPNIKEIFKTIQAETGLKGKPLFMPVRLKLTGQLHGAELANIIPILGKDLTLKRLKA
jgi:nondiscriminating glutamyl-tRNA synthetase